MTTTKFSTWRKSKFAQLCLIKKIIIFKQVFQIFQHFKRDSARHSFTHRRSSSELKVNKCFREFSNIFSTSSPNGSMFRFCFCAQTNKNKGTFKKSLLFAWLQFNYFISFKLEIIRSIVLLLILFLCNARGTPLESKTGWTNFL